jgi:hypothetical protein
VLGRHHVGPVTAPYRYLDKLYMQVLAEAAGLSTRGAVEPLDELEEADEVCQRVKSVVAVIVIAQAPLLANGVAALSGVSLEDALITMDDLSALLLMDDGEPVQIFHPSFPDFMLDPKRCEEPRLHLTPSVAHALMAFQCLRVMNESLHYNICELSDPDLPNVDVVDLETRLTEHVSNALRYACCFWLTHVVNCGSPDSQLRNELATFCSKHLFHWLEVLSLLQFWSSADSNALIAIEWCEVW